jgi:hypothetical protein
LEIRVTIWCALKLACLWLVNFHCRGVGSGAADYINVWVFVFSEIHRCPIIIQNLICLFIKVRSFADLDATTLLDFGWKFYSAKLLIIPIESVTFLFRMLVFAIKTRSKVVDDPYRIYHCVFYRMFVFETTTSLPLKNIYTNWTICWINYSFINILIFLLI